MECERVIPGGILDDLCSRFIINVPDEERRDLIRICFQIESAHWFYLDFYSKNFPTKKPCGFREFAQQIFKHLPFLQPYANNVEKIIDEWKDYKFCVPTFGAILLDEDLSHVLLVQSYCSRSSWGFPKGKINKDEPPYQCAIREVYEETGFDISRLINTNQYIEANVNEQTVRLYIIPGINKFEKFEPKTRNEIKAVNWFPICDIPVNRKEATLKQSKVGNSANTFFLVAPFLRKLRQWIFELNQRIPTKQFYRQRHKSCSDIDCIQYRDSTLNLKESVAMLKRLKDPKVDVTSTKASFSEESVYKVDSTKDTFIEDDKKMEAKHATISSNQESSENDTFNKNYCAEQVSSKILIPNTRLSNPHTENLENSNVGAINIGVDCDRSAEYIKTNNGLPVSDLQAENSLELVSLIKAPIKQNVDILSSKSAFKKVEKSVKANKRRRGKRSVKSSKHDETNFYANDNLDLKTSLSRNELHGSYNGTSKNSPNSPQQSSRNSHCFTPVYEPAINISAWSNFRFDLNSIFKSMDEAASNGHLKK